MGMKPKGVDFWTCPILPFLNPLLEPSADTTRWEYEWPGSKNEGQDDGDSRAIEFSDFSLCRERGPATTKACRARISAGEGIQEHQSRSHTGVYCSCQSGCAPENENGVWSVWVQR